MTDTVLSVEEHFETLRDAVWLRFAARHRDQDRARFEDLYSEWWARELERAASGSPSRAAAPAAFIAEAVHRVLIDDVRSRARGIGRDEKAALQIVDIDEELRTPAMGDTASTATYEALVHRVLTLIQGRLSERETRVFVWSYLYLQPSEVTAEALGLSTPRVKKDRKKIASKVGAEVWSVLAGELDLCAAYDEKSLPAIFEILTVHVEDCPVCGSALGGVRRGALAVVGPELMLLGAAEQMTHGFSDLLARAGVWLHRGSETLAAVPPSGRTAAAVAVAATAVAGGTAAVAPHARRPAPRVAAAHPSATRTPRPRPTATVTVVPTPARTPAPEPAVRPHRVTKPRPEKTAAPVEPEEPIAFESQAPASSLPAPVEAAAQPSPAPASGDEFGIESP